MASKRSREEKARLKKIYNRMVKISKRTDVGHLEFQECEQVVCDHLSLDTGQSAFLGVCAPRK